MASSKNICFMLKRAIRSRMSVFCGANFLARTSSSSASTSSHIRGRPGQKIKRVRGIPLQMDRLIQSSLRLGRLPIEQVRLPEIVEYLESLRLKFVCQLKLAERDMILA